MPVDFLGIGATHDGTEISPRSGAAFDRSYTVRLARAHEENGWDRLLFAYSSSSPDPSQAAALVAADTDAIRLVVAHRPNVSAPTYAATSLATLDQASGGRVQIHIITGGSTADQAAEGDHLPKDERYDRTREYIRILKKAWTSPTPFDHVGRHYRIQNFVSDVPPATQPRPLISFGGSSAAAYTVGGAEADVFALWGEPLAGTREQIASVDAAAAAAGRADRPAIQVAFRPIIAPTRAAAEDKAHRILDRLRDAPRGRPGAPENAGSQRLLVQAGAADRHDRALWTSTAAATGGAGNSTALVGTPEVVAAALLDYYDLGVRHFSARGYDLLTDAVEFGREVIPLVKAEVARREADNARQDRFVAAASAFALA
ncbi:LLM class flavin-dependent oxidoreductase [Nakamurella deserti]|uniref:LLM class flavin-dependent oxidoreductase n=1 Tax=Nakamurella deserti TaxID=2164074 RepID=UPI000DBE0F84|nr:LLM class flavin-dependent oxidoreductase [Nakamurella deserti]